MAINSVTASCEITLGVLPGFIFINTSDTLAQVMTIGYLNGQTINPTGYLMAPPAFSNQMMALVTTIDSGTVQLLVNIDTELHVNLVAPSAV